MSLPYATAFAVHGYSRKGEHVSTAWGFTVTDGVLTLVSFGLGACEFAGRTGSSGHII